MQIGAPVVTTSISGDIMHGRVLAFDRTEQVDQPNRTDVANGVANPRRFRATREFFTILFLHNGRLFQQSRNMAFVYPEPYRTPIEGLDVADGKPLSLEDLIQQAMAAQRAAVGGTDGTALVVEAPVPSSKTKASAA